MPIIRQATPGPSRRNNPYYDTYIGYPSHLSPRNEPQLLQPYPDQQVPENPPPPPRRKGRPPIRRVNRTEKIEITYQHIMQAIEQKHLEPAKLHQGLEDHNNEEMIILAADNLIQMARMTAIQEIKNLYLLGYGLDIKIENELPFGFISWTDIGRRLQIKDRHIRLGRRIYQMFRLWPEAMDQLNQVTISDLEYLTNEEAQLLTLRLIMAQPADQENPLGHLII